MFSVLLKHVLLASIRDKLILAVIAAAIVVSALAIFVGSTAVIEKNQFVLVFMASGLRFLMGIGLILFTIFYTRRSIESKDLDFLLSRPITRASYVWSHLFALWIIALVFALTAMLFLIGFGFAYFSEAYFLWVLSFFFELALVSAASFFFAMVLNSAVTATLSTLAFYALSRMIGQILGIALDPYTLGNHEFLSQLVKTLSLFVPRLDLFTQSTWLTYGEEQFSYLFVIICLQGIVYSVLFAIATIIDLKQKEF